MLEEINRSHSDPAAYAKQVLQPLTEMPRRIPKDPVQPYEASRIWLSDDPIDYMAGRCCG